MFRVGLFRRRRPRSRKSLLAAVTIVLVWLGFDHVQKSQQTGESWQGTILRVHQERPFLGSNRSPSHRYWEVRTTDGEKRDVRVYSRERWGAGLPGQYVVKQAGELDPRLAVRP